MPERPSSSGGTKIRYNRCFASGEGVDGADAKWELGIAQPLFNRERLGSDATFGGSCLRRRRGNVEGQSRRALTQVRPLGSGKTGDGGLDVRKGFHDAHESGKVEHLFYIRLDAAKRKSPPLLRASLALLGSTRRPALLV